MSFAEEFPPIYRFEDTNDLRLTFGFLNAAVIAGTLLGCTFFLYLFYLERKHRKISHNYVISMCCGDILHAGLGCSMVIWLCNELKLSDDRCPLATCLLMLSVYVSLFTLTSAAIDRYIAICRPLEYQKKMTHSLSYCIISLGWILAPIAATPLYFMRSNKSITKPNELCLYLAWVYDLEYLLGYLMLIMSICVIIVVILYAKIYISLRKMFHSSLGTTEFRSILTYLRDNKENTVIGLLKVREVKVTCIMFATVMSFVLCWTPCIIVVFFFNHKPNEVTKPILIAYLFPKFYSMINPIFYAYAIKNVRLAFNRNLRRLFGLRRIVEKQESEKKVETQETS
ncbi:adenosine receptor A3-like [Culicoides brevitarsis]|uniref:adenosine receptor A3-like n=1 Tax=Culicoides brevitarsis TaxID=469753 RepID=UPI00307B6629